LDGCNAKNNFWIAIPDRKIGRKKFENKLEVFIFKKVKMRVGVYFSVALWIWDTWDMAEKNSLGLIEKYRLSPISPSARLQITQNLVEDLFICILFYFEVERTLFG
jgi:hypothetical protein